MTDVLTDPVLPAFRHAIYNPNRLSDEEIKASFIVRQALLEALLEDIDSTRPGGIPQHHFIAGQRGMGKTMLLCRLGAALREPGRRARFLPLRFPEEQWTIDRLSKYWLNCLDSMADALEREGGNTELVRRLDETVERLRQDTGKEELLAEAAEKAFLELAGETQRRAVLLVDNLDYVFDRLEAHEMNRLRAALMKAGAPLLIGAGIVPPQATLHYEAPFYDHFKTHYLDRLSLEEMIEVLTQLARQAGQPEIARRIASERPRLSALHALTGGNPRTMVILYQIFTKGFSQEAYQDLEALLDWMTPLYKARFEELSLQIQVVVGALASHWEPISAGQLGRLVQLENSQVSPQLDRLKKMGFIEEVVVDPEDRLGPLPAGPSPQSRTGYQLAERFFNIWFLMRQATRRDRRNLTFLTRFIECIHTPAERSAMARDLLSHHGLSRANRIYGLALEDAVAEDSLRYELHDHVQQEIVAASRAFHEKIDDLIDPAEIPPHRFAFAELREKLRAAVPPDSDISGEEFADAILGSAELVGRREAIASQSLDDDTIRKLLELARQDQASLASRYGLEAAEWLKQLLLRATLTDWRDPHQVSNAVRQARSKEQLRLCLQYARPVAKQQIDPDAWKRICAFLAPSTERAAEWLAWADALYHEFRRPEEAETAARKALKIDPLSAGAWNHLGGILSDVDGRYSEAEAAYRKCIELDATCAGFWYNLGRFLQVHSNRFEEAQTAYRKAIELDPQFAWPWNGLGNLLQDHWHLFGEAEAAYRKAIELNPQDPGPWNNLGKLLQHSLYRFEDAEAAYRKATTLDPLSASPWNNLGDLFQDRLKRFEEAEAAYRKAIEIDPQNARSWNNLGNLLNHQLHRVEEAEAAYRKAIEYAPQDSSPWNNLGTLLQDSLHRFEEAERAYRTAIELEPKNARPWNNLGTLLKNQLRRFEEAETAYRKAIELEPRYASPWNNLGNLLVDHLGRFEEAEAAYRKSIELDPKDAKPWNNLGDLLQKHADRFEEAEEAYRKALTLDARNLRIWNQLGLLLNDCLGRGTEAVEAFRKAIELDPQTSFVPAANLVGVLRDQLGRNDEALQVYRNLPETKEQSLRTVIPLHAALFAAHAENWGIAAENLGKALDLLDDKCLFPEPTLTDWMWASAVLLHLGYGVKLLEYLQARGEDQRLRPWYEAIRAHLRGDRRYLRNAPVEVRPPAEVLYDQIALRLRHLPDTSRRWSPPTCKKVAAKASKR